MFELKYKNILHPWLMPCSGLPRSPTVPMFPVSGVQAEERAKLELPQTNFNSVGRSDTEWKRVTSDGQDKRGFSRWSCGTELHIVFRQHLQRS